MQEQPHKFDDQRLQKAVYHAWGQEQAPASLRRRIEQSIVITELAEEVPPRQPASLPLWQQLAAAAVILLCIGVIVYQVQEFFGIYRPGPTPGGGQYMASLLPAHLTAELVARHDTCSTLQDHHTVQAPPNDFVRIAQQLGVRVGGPVIAASLMEDGWHFHGASACLLGQARVSHLVYLRGDQSLSLVSIPPAHCGAVAGQKDEHKVMADYVLAAFEHDGGIHAVIAHCPGGELDLQEIIQLRNKLRKHVIAPPPGVVQPVSW